MCTSCNTKNQFKSHYASNISEQQLPAELIRDFTTIEYILPPAVPATQQQPQKPIFLLMVDTAIDSEELTELKDSLQ
jgi:protein transport protein SEC23